MEFNAPEDGFRWFESLVNLERAPSRRRYHLQKMEKMLDDFNHPERDIAIIHIAGSKGKGSTASFLASAIASGGYRVGRYLSPHVSSYRERIECFPDALSSDAIVETMREIYSYVDRQAPPSNEMPTTFELLTLLAFLLFRATRREWAVVETGLGGRLDATNVVLPRASVITPIELEHREYLGDTLEAIATEKAGIIKERRPLFIGYQQPDAMSPIIKRANALRAPTYPLERHLKAIEWRGELRGGRLASYASIEFRGADKPIQTHLRLAAPVQAYNAALALLIINTLPELSRITSDRVIDGINNAFAPGRFELLEHSPPFIIDGAHTPGSIEATIAAYRAYIDRSAYGNGGLIFGAAAKKDIAAMAKLTAPHFSWIITTRPDHVRAVDAEYLASLFRRYHRDVESRDNIGDALRRARERAGRSSPILATGSFYLIGALRNEISSAHNL